VPQSDIPRTGQRKQSHPKTALQFKLLIVDKADENAGVPWPLGHRFAAPSSLLILLMQAILGRHLVAVLRIASDLRMASTLWVDYPSPL